MESEVVVQTAPNYIYLNQDWPHFFAGYRNCIKKNKGQKNVLKKAWQTKFNLFKTLHVNRLDLKGFISRASHATQRLY